MQVSIRVGRAVMQDKERALRMLPLNETSMRGGDGGLSQDMPTCHR